MQMNKKLLIILICIMIMLIAVLPVTGTLNFIQTPTGDNSPTVQAPRDNVFVYRQTPKTNEALSICFVPPTPEDGTIQEEVSIPINLSVSDNQEHYSMVDFNHDL